MSASSAKLSSVKKFEELSIVKLEDALLCANCELIVSEAIKGRCPVCGSSALLGLFRLLGGTLQRPSPEPFLRKSGRAKPTRGDAGLLDECLPVNGDRGQRAS